MVCTCEGLEAVLLLMSRPKHEGHLENDTSHMDILIIVLETR